MRHTTLLLVLLAGCTFDEPAPTDEEWNEVSTAAPTHNPDNCPGGSGPGGGPGGKPIPAPRDCTQEPTWEQCYDCCDWNAKHSWGATCKRLKEPDRSACWRRLESELRPACYKACKRPDGPITTVAP